MTCQKCGKNNKSSHKCVDDVVYAPEKENKKMSESDKLLLTFQKVLGKYPYLFINIRCSPFLLWEVSIWDDNEFILWKESGKDKNKVCRIISQKLEQYSGKKKLL